MSASQQLTFGEAALLVAIVNAASFLAVASAVVAICTGVRKLRSTRSSLGITCGGIALFLGALIMYLSDRPLPSFERPAFYRSMVAVLLGTVAIVLSFLRRAKNAEVQN